ncbi:hypothetical protein AYO38_07040 [bacterium SCGC AG-212-C10]|nr:hypothetical protein AYO38_07040 [bacterium SCGC AG-212-C10]
MRGALGVGGLAATTFAGLGRAQGTSAAGAGDPRPIPGGSPGLAAALGELFHVYAPGIPGLDDANAEPSTITDFDGVVGLAYISGMVRRTNTVTGEVLDLPFVDSDMRFMKGTYRDMAGKMRGGAFAFI